MKNVIKYTLATLLALATIVSVWFLLNNLRPLSPGLYSFSVAFVVGLSILLKLFAEQRLRQINTSLKKLVKWRYFSISTLFVITILGLLVRLYFYSRFSYAPVSDPVTFYEAGQRIADGRGMTGDSYAAFFPYLAAYNSILGIAMRIISDPWLATILLNTIFDFGGALAVYFLVKQLSKPGSKLPIIAFGAWFLSPFNILFSVLSLPIIVVNFFIVSTLLIICLLNKGIITRRQTLTIALALLLGATMGIGNSFRPVFTIAIIALFVLLLYVSFMNRWDRKILVLAGSSLLLVILLFFGIQKLNSSLVASQTGLSPASNASGWSIFVGSNWESDGKWNRVDEIKMQYICRDTKTYDDCHEKLQFAGIERYKHHGIDGTISLFIRKLYVFSSNQGNIYNATGSIINYSDSRAEKTLNIYITLFLIALFSLSARFLYYSARLVLSGERVEPMVLFMALLLLGFFLSITLVETSERYAQIMYPVFIVLATLSLGMRSSKVLRK